MKQRNRIWQFTAATLLAAIMAGCGGGSSSSSSGSSGTPVGHIAGVATPSSVSVVTANNAQ